MKVYVDELPKICKDCACLNRVNGRCQLLHLYVDEDEKQEDCPLQLLSEHDKQVRKEVCEEIRKKVLEYFNVKNEEEYENSLSLLDALFTADVVFEILDLIQADYVEKVEE